VYLRIPADVGQLQYRQVERWMGGLPQWGRHEAEGRKTSFQDSRAIGLSGKIGKRKGKSKGK
jgi:hypothetical protein